MPLAVAMPFESGEGRGGEKFRRRPVPSVRKGAPDDDRFNPPNHPTSRRHHHGLITIISITTIGISPNCSSSCFSQCLLHLERRKMKNEMMCT